MSEVVIRVEDVSKQYRLGDIGTGSISHDINRWWHRILGKEDPYLKIGEENDRTKKGDSQYVWALRDINFEVKQGEVLGIIGKNGAGKSTLLKILSRTTTPTVGNIKLKGRIASLLEVGTGFHPELSGRDNIFLNGAILGMKKIEIKRKFDEIVEFAGVERYIDTPVKRYSSGMYIRLAFGVAAHLEPEILIVDEVLAVGDAEFQKKCLGKMKDVSDKDGRTVLFVSHNMIAVKSLCSKAMYMRNGSVIEMGETTQVINNYLSNQQDKSLLKFFNDPGEAPGNEKARLRKIEVCPQLNDPADPITVKTPLTIEIEFWNFEDGKLINLTMFFNTFSGESIFANGTPAVNLSAGLHKASCYIPADLLNDEVYSITLMIVGDTSYSICTFDNILSFEVGEERIASGWHGKWPGFVRPKLDFKILS
ncbi:ABC transporter ATP-binding protein [Puia dinghuensis]|uniref:ABC transporter ATP-binding protein n=1 Tax=Puia dinghuensis TaxID=1792502 RepID=A0A8J2XU43_9BACT|nr:ABC transporter ATP-binding protein [Puia dinghuensis]GGB08633.1 ABC transporter ATP-binding protein [Puia dinghuensis]